MQEIPDNLYRDLTRHMIKRYKIMLLISGIIVVSLTAAVLVTAAAKNRTYTLLAELVATQPFADKLPKNPKHISIECYPEGKINDRCLAVRYPLSAEVCQSIAEALGTNARREECNYAQEVRQHGNERVMYNTGRSLDGGYNLTVSIGH